MLDFFEYAIGLIVSLIGLGIVIALICFYPLPMIGIILFLMLLR